MDNLCHTLVGVAVAQAGFKSRTALAAATGAIAANLPDLDVLVFLTDIPSVAFRRGITHGAPAQILLPVVCAGIMWSIGQRRRASASRVDFGWLLVLSYIGVLSHVGLDLLNTYGVRLLSPISQRWFYGDSVFIIDIWLWLILGIGVFLAWRAGTRQRTGGPGAGERRARLALLIATLYVAGMVVSARMARRIVFDAWTATGEPVQALMVGPQPGSILRKNIIVDAGDRYIEGRFRWLPMQVSFDGDVTPKNSAAAGVAEAREDARIAGFLVWSRFPYWQTRDLPEGREVRVRDVRFKRGPGMGGFTAATVVRH